MQDKAGVVAWRQSEAAARECAEESGYLVRTEEHLVIESVIEAWNSIQS